MNILMGRLNEEGSGNKIIKKIILLPTLILRESQKYFKK